MTDLFHAAADKLAPLVDRIFERIADAAVVLGDETSLKMQSPKKRGFVWVFINPELIGYRFSSDRSGETPSAVLGGTRGTLVVDGYTGYNKVTAVDGRTRAGCMAHCRRKFFDALPTAPEEARRALDLILDLYRIEHKALEDDIVRTQAHRERRQLEGKPAMERFKSWLAEQQSLHPPKGPLGKAIRYANNNASERALRVVALGRKNFLFVGNEAAGQHLAILYSLVQTCELHGVNPTEYLADVLVRIDDHPAAGIDELLPDRWSPRPRA